MITVESLSDDFFIAEAENNYYLVYAINQKEYLITRIDDKIDKLKNVYNIFKFGSLWISTIKNSKQIEFFEIEPLLTHLK